MKKIVLIFILIFSVISLYSQVVINEYSAANYDNYQDNYLNYEDWIELYNINLSVSTMNIYQRKKPTNIYTAPDVITV